MNKTFIVNTTSSMAVSNNTVTATAVAANFTGQVTTENRTVIVGIRKCKIELLMEGLCYNMYSIQQSCFDK